MKKTVRFTYQSPDGSWLPCKIVVTKTVPKGGMAGHCRGELSKLKIKYKKVAITSIEEED